MKTAVFLTFQAKSKDPKLHFQLGKQYGVRTPTHGMIAERIGGIEDVRLSDGKTGERCKIEDIRNEGGDENAICDQSL